MLLKYPVTTNDFNDNVVCRGGGGGGGGYII